MSKSIDDLKRHLIVVVDLEFDFVGHNDLKTIKKSLKVGNIISYCYGYIDSWCNLTDNRNFKDDLKKFILNYILDSLRYFQAEAKDKYE